MQSINDRVEQKVIKRRPNVTIHRGGDHGLASYEYTSNVVSLTIENEYDGPWSTCLRFIFDGEHACTLLVRVSRQSSGSFGKLGDLLYTVVNELPLIEDRFIVKNANPTRWSSNKLTNDDAFLKMYRDYMKTAHPDILERYVQ